MTTHAYRTRRGPVPGVCRPAPEPAPELPPTAPTRRAALPPSGVAVVATITAAVLVLVLALCGIAGRPIDGDAIGIGFLGAAAIGLLALAAVAILQAE